MDPVPECDVDPDGHARQVLEFDRVLALCAAEARTEGGRERVRRRVPAADAARVVVDQADVAEVRAGIDAGLGAWPLDGAHDARPLLAAAARTHEPLDATALGQLADTLDVCARLRRFLDAHAAELPRAHAGAAALVAHDEFVAAVRRAIDERGQVRDEASPQLQQARRAILAQREALLKKLEALLRRLEAPDAYVTQRGDRYVVPVRADAGGVPGIVHDRSASGATLFVEPLDAVEPNNELQRRRDVERREVRRVLAELTARLTACLESARASVDVLHVLDALHARATWSARIGAVSPRAGTAVRLRAARHPLLDLQLRAGGGGAVPLDLDLGDARALVVTGPNTGGKTVALKTIGLLALMHQSGLQIPAAADSELPVFARVHADIGDEQSIDAAASTFSSHLRHVVQLLEDPARPVLALLDEFMAGTDPQEGAALAKVVLRKLVARAGATFVTTHLGELKLFAHAEPGVANAAMAFDGARRTPLFRLQTGVPGSSNAIAIAARLGMPADLVAAAEAERGEAAGRMEDLLASLAAERARWSAAAETAEAAAAEARRMREEHARELAALAKARRGAAAEARRDAERFLAEAKARVERVVRDLRSSNAGAGSIRAARDELQALRTEAEVPPPEPGAAPGRLEPGGRVWVRSLGREGILEEPVAGARARVRLGNVSLSVPAEDLEPRARAPETAGAVPGGYVAPETGTVPTRLDLRGMPRDEALQAVDQFLDRLLLQGVHQAEIVHGKGTGALRRAVQALLATHPQIAAFRLGEHGEGGHGVTIVMLR